MKYSLIIILAILINDLQCQIPKSGTSTWTHYEDKIVLYEIPIPTLEILNNSFNIKEKDSGFTSNSYYEKSTIGKINNCKLQVSIEESFFTLELKIEMRTESKHQTLNLINQLNQQFQTPNFEFLNKETNHHWDKTINSEDIKIFLMFSDNYTVATCIILNEIEKRK